MSACASYLVMYLLLTECHQNDRNEEVEHHKGHKYNARTNEECTKYWVVVQNLNSNKEEINRIIFCFSTIKIV